MKKVFFITVILLLAACVQQNEVKPVIGLPSQQIVKSTYAPVYQVTQQTYYGRVNQHFNVDSFVHGVIDWFNGKYKQPISELKHQLYEQGKGFDAYIYDYYSGIIFAADLQTNFQRLNCWQQVDIPTLEQAIYDALRDMKNQTPSHNRSWLDQSSEQFARQCLS
ncbi:hypothetical protein P375_02135 [Gallibacterium genomosp. 2]|uniref:Lipoprotein n=1 Tax=Gallibacterium genomosp. 2 TaxID=155517 RepID=A0A0A2XS66_9PAST|nr:hypothetical protein [Gallibacterium genomosp. 2]KGQ33832.1 hypothetical protein P375_02135 [Gallibacterium genomosp. 2]